MRLLITLLIPIFIVPSLLGQYVEESITYDTDKGIYWVYYWSITDSVYYEIPFFPGNKCKPIVSAGVEKNNSVYKYTYSLFNDNDSVRELYEFSVEVDQNVFDIEAPNIEWSGDYVLWKNAVRWAHVNSVSDTIGTLPGQEVDGIFAFSSTNLPGIILAYAASYWGLGNSPDEGPFGEINILIDSLMQATRHVEIITIGPKDPPHPFVPLDFLDMLIIYKDEAFELGWITHEGIKNSLNQKLYDARGELEVGNITAAGNILQAFINEVEALNRAGQHITGEAYALLKYNAEYLIGRLE